MANKFVSFLEAAGKVFLKGLGFAVKYALPVANLAALIFPGTGTVAAGVVNAVDLVQKAVITVEQKYAASGVQNGTGAQKLAEVLELTNNAVLDLLAKEGLQVDSAYVTKIVNAVVAILNLQNGAPVTTA